MDDSWVLREWRDAHGHVCKAVMSRREAARPDEELRAQFEEWLAAHPPQNAPSDPLGARMTDNANAFVIERAAGLAAPGRPIGLADLGARMTSDDPALTRLVDQLVEDAIAALARQRHTGI